MTGSSELLGKALPQSSWLDGNVTGLGFAKSMSTGHSIQASVKHRLLTKLHSFSEDTNQQSSTRTLLTWFSFQLIGTDIKKQSEFLPCEESVHLA